MNPALESLLAAYGPKSADDYVNSLKEIVQHLALLGLWRAKFYDHAAFYGGTCLRIFHRLDRFSEDLDFSLLSPQERFDFAPYLQAIELELLGAGFSMQVRQKQKRDSDAILSAFIKGNTSQNLLLIGAPSSMSERLHGRSLLKVKFEIDTEPPPGASYTLETLLSPIPFTVRTFALGDLMAGKLHAVLCRNWKTRVKGRDFFDLLWYISRGVVCNLAHLRERMVQSGHLDAASPALSRQALHEHLRARFAAVDFAQARDDVRPFVRDPHALDLWGEAFFVGLLPRLQAA